MKRRSYDLRKFSPINFEAYSMIKNWSKKYCCPMMKMEERNEDKNVIESLILILSTGRMIFKHSRRSMNLKVNKNQWGKKRTETILQAWNILTNGSYIIYFPTLTMSQSYPQPVMLSPLKTFESQPTTTSSLWIFPYILYLTKNNNNKTQTKKNRTSGNLYFPNEKFLLENFYIPERRIH